MKVLVTCHARAPFTRAVGNEIASALQADVDLIIPRAPSDGMFGWLRSTYDATFHRATDIALPARSLDAYDLVVIGSPGCGGALASPVRTYMERHRAHLRTVALFATCSGRGGEHTLDQMTSLCNRHPVARLVVRELESGEARSAIADFTKRIMARVSTPPAAA